MPTDPRLLLKWVASGDIEALQAADFSNADSAGLATLAVQKDAGAVLALLLGRCDVEADLLRHLAGIAVLLGHLEALKVIGDQLPRSLHEPDDEGKTLAFLAASVGRVEVLQLLASAAPVSLGLPNRGGVTPIDVAWHRGYSDCVNLLRGLGIPDPMERWQSCCEGEACEPKPVPNAKTVLS